MHYLFQIGTQLVHTYFPELEETIVEYDIRKTRHKGMEALEEKKGKKYLVRVDPRIVELPHEIMMGWVAHELAHCSAWKKNNKKRPLVLKRKDIIAEERTTDMDVVTRGLGLELLACNDWVLHDRKVWRPEFGLHPSEIRAILAHQANTRNGTLKTPSRRYR
jgi:hypothetical protein